MLKKLGLNLSKKQIEDVVNCLPGAIEEVLKNVYLKLSKYNEGSKDDERQVNYDNSNIGNNSGKKIVPTEQNYKEMLLQKDMIIYELKSTLEVRV